MKHVYFKTPTLLSHLDLMSMGGSDKADDVTSIGTYNSGLKFSMALALRNNIDFSVKVYDDTFSDNHDRKRETLYTINTFTEECGQTGKTKELIRLHKNVSLESHFSVHTSDYGGGHLPEEIISTGFSSKLGIDWKLYMLLREIYSNMVDEKGEYSEIPFENVKYGTVVRLSFKEGSEFDEIWQNRHLYINEESPLYTISYNVEALKNDEGYLRIYKQNILVYEDKKRPSKFAYNIKMGELDEKRILSNIYSIENDIAYAIKNTDCESFLREIITKDFKVEKDEFLSNMSVYGTASDLIHNIACEVFNEYEEVNTYPWLLNSIKERKDCGISGRKIQSIADSVNCYSTKVTVQTNPSTFSTPETIETEEGILEDAFVAEIKRYYNFNLDVEVKKAKLSGNKCIADKHNKCIIIDEDFNIEEDFPCFIVEYLDLTRPGNVVKNMSKYICELLAH